MNNEIDSQLSAMFDGELPPVECELLSRRIDRDDGLRARWSRYALIGAAMRCEPVATASADFAEGVSLAVEHESGRGGARARRGGALLWQSALAATLVVAVAGLSIVMLRNVALGPAVGTPVRDTVLVKLQAASAAGPELAAARSTEVVLGAAENATASVPSRQEPLSYVTPQGSGKDAGALRTELVDYIVAHSEYSTPLMRPDLLSALISGGEDEAGLPAASRNAADVLNAQADASAGQMDATPAPAVTH